MFANIHGSIGIVESHSYQNKWNVEWCYGKDKANEYWKSYSRSVDELNLIKINDILYNEYINQPCFNDKQKEIRNKILEEIK